MVEDSLKTNEKTTIRVQHKFIKAELKMMNFCFYKPQTTQTNVQDFCVKMLQHCKSRSYRISSKHILLFQ